MDDTPISLIASRSSRVITVCIAESHDLFYEYFFREYYTSFDLEYALSSEVFDISEGLEEGRVEEEKSCIT